MGLRAERSVAHRASPSLTVAAFFVSRKRPSAGNGHASLLPFYLQSVGRRSCEMHASSVFAFFTCCVMDGWGVEYCSVFVLSRRVFRSAIHVDLLGASRTIEGHFFLDGVNECDADQEVRGALMLVLLGIFCFATISF